MKTRNLKDWIKAYEEYTLKLKLEAPDSYHLWTGVSTVASALERKVHYRQIPTKPLYANQYIILVGPPGRCRKGGALSCGEFFVTGLKPAVNLCADSASRKGIVTSLIRSQTTTDKLYTHSSLSVSSKELGVLLNNAEARFMENLCDWWDCGNSRGDWIHETQGGGEEKVQGVWFNILGATVPLGHNKALSNQVINSGFSARAIFVVEYEARFKYGRRVKFTDTLKALQKALIEDLEIIHKITGEYDITPEAQAFYDHWYEKENKIPLNTPDYLMAFKERMHSHLFKVGMVFAAARRNELVLEVEDIKSAKAALEATIPGLEKMFGGIGKSIHSQELHEVFEFIKAHSVTGVSKLKVLRHFKRDIDLLTFKSVIDTLVDSREIERVFTAEGREVFRLPLKGGEE